MNIRQRGDHPSRRPRCAGQSPAGTSCTSRRPRRNAPGEPDTAVHATGGRGLPVDVDPGHPGADAAGDLVGDGAKPVGPLGGRHGGVALAADQDRLVARATAVAAIDHQLVHGDAHDQPAPPSMSTAPRRRQAAAPSAPGAGWRRCCRCSGGGGRRRCARHHRPASRSSRASQRQRRASRRPRWATPTPGTMP
jgi:hypothetical protein